MIGTLQNPFKCDIVWFHQILRNGDIPFGSFFCIKNGERGWIDGAIAHVQRKALQDLNKIGKEEKIFITDSQARFYSQYTHCGMVANLHNYVHAYYPNVHYTDWENLVDKTILFRLPLPFDESKLSVALGLSEKDVKNKEPYDLMDLLGFYCRWHTKILFRIKFQNIFGSRKHDVCSTRVRRWYINSGVIMPTSEDKTEQWGWYPARMGSDSFAQDLAHITITK